MKTSAKRGRPGKAVKRIPQDLPDFCDFDCPHASFPLRDSIGACRREQAVYCTLFKQLNNKHTSCLAKKGH
jgi:hypothetical protein